MFSIVQMNKVDLVRCEGACIVRYDGTMYCVLLDVREHVLSAVREHVLRCLLQRLLEEQMSTDPVVDQLKVSEKQKPTAVHQHETGIHCRVKRKYRK